MTSYMRRSSGLLILLRRFLRIPRGNLNGYLQPVKLVDVTITVYRKLSTAELRQLLPITYAGL